MAKSRRVRCPPGVFCISGGLGTTIFIIVSVALLFFLYAIFFTRPRSEGTTIIMPPTATPKTTIIPIKGGDSRYDMAPQPLRDWMAPPEFPPRGGIASIPINIPTQGLPESFQSVGVVRVEDKILPLYGRRTTGGSDRWNYYTRTDTYNPVPIPINFQRRQCMDDVGCQEILSGDEVKVDVMNKTGKTSIYRYDGPKYIPGLI
jgi:hypothetical protein